MPTGWSRRRLLGSVGPLLVAGCLGPDLPAGCPTTHDLGVPWPESLTESTVASFVEQYEHVYYRDVVVAYEPRSRLDSYELSGSVTSPREVANEYELGVYGEWRRLHPDPVAGSPDR